MAPKSVLWKLFHSNNEHYKLNKSHLNAFCIGCMKLCMDELCTSDSTAVATGELPVRNLAFRIVTPICGKPKQLLAHAERCQLLRPNNLGSNLLQETLDLNKLRIAQNADKENTAPALLPTQLMPARRRCSRRRRCGCIIAALKSHLQHCLISPDWTMA